METWFLIYYGSKWNDIRQNTFSFFGKSAFCKDKIVAIYEEGNNRIIENEGRRGNYPSNFVVFDIHGNYIQTLETGYSQILRFCYDNENNRIIMIMNDMIQFAYLDLDGIV